MVSEIKNKTSRLQSFIDEAFDAKKTASYELMLQLSVNQLLIAVNDRSKNKYIALEEYTFGSVYNFDAVAELLDPLLKESILAHHKFQSVVCTIVNSLSTLVPNALFEEDRKKMYLKFNTALEGNELVMVDDIKSLEAKNVFALPFTIKAKLNYHFNNIKYHHASSTLIDSLVADNINKPGKKLFIHVQSTHFEAVVIENKNLLFYNTFNHYSAEDFIYYLLFVCEQMQLNPETAEVTILGEIEKNSAIYSIANKYIRNLKFGERSDDASDYSYQLQTLPKHYYYTLFNRYFS
jgi:hypothetical protein